MPLPKPVPRTDDERAYAAEFDRATRLLMEIEDLLDGMPQIGDPVRAITTDDAQTLRECVLLLDRARRAIPDL